MIFSNRKLKLIIITLLLLIFCFFLGMFKPKAMVYSESIQATTLTITQGSFNGRPFTFNAEGHTGSEPFRNKGEGFLQFTLATAGSLEIYGIEAVLSDGTVGMCTTEYMGYSDSNKAINNFNVTCPVNTSNNKYVDYIWMNGWAYASTRVTSSTFATLYNFEKSDNNNVTVETWSDYDKELIKSYLYNISINTANQNLTNQTISNNTNDIKNNTSDIKDSINDSSIDSNAASSSASTWNGKNATNGTITQLLTLPITLLQAIVNGISTSCSSFSLGSLFGTNITLPCINLSNLIGSGLFTTIDILFSGFMILSIGKKLIKIFNDFTNLKSNQIDELYGGGN